MNINTRAKVILTAHGAEVLNSYNRQFHISGDYQKDNQMFPVNYVVGDIYETELWELMHIFGPYLTHGCNIPFKNNEIEFTK